MYVVLAALQNETWTVETRGRGRLIHFDDDATLRVMGTSTDYHEAKRAADGLQSVLHRRRNRKRSLDYHLCAHAGLMVVSYRRERLMAYGKIIHCAEELHVYYGQAVVCVAVGDQVLVEQTLAGLLNEPIERLYRCFSTYQC